MRKEAVAHWGVGVGVPKEQKIYRQRSFSDVKNESINSLYVVTDKERR